MIVHVTPSYPPRLGGLEKVVQVLAQAQAMMGLNVSVITSDHGAKAGVQDDTVAVTRLKSFEFANTTVVPGLFRKLLKLESTDVVHLHVTQAFTPEMVWLAAKVRRFSYVAHIHLDVPPSGPAGFLLKLYKPLFLKRVLRSAKAVIVFTQDQKEATMRQYWLNSKNVHVIPNGVEAKFYYDKPRKLSHKPSLLFVGRLNYQKNVTQLLSALAGVSEKFKTIIVGEGELKAELQAQASELHLKNISFVGRIDGSPLLDYYRSADIFVLPSEREGMPLVLLEAMAMGLPIVATDVTGNHDVVVDKTNGLLVPYADSDAFKSALTQLANNPATYSRYSNASRRLADSYSWEKVAKQVTMLYGTLS